MVQYKKIMLVATLVGSLATVASSIYSAYKNNKISETMSLKHLDSKITIRQETNGNKRKSIEI